MPRTNKTSGGRIRPEQRDTDDSVPILGTTLEAPIDLSTGYMNTMKLDMTDTCRKDYRNRIKRMIKYWRENCADYYQVGVRTVSQEYLGVERYYYYNRFTEDIIYQGLNVQYVLHFLFKTKYKQNGKLKSMEDVRKYKDAIMWGAKILEERLPTQFFSEMDKYLAAYKKEWAQAKKKGQAEDVGADPIPFSIYQLILQWAIKNNNPFVWVWTLLQWNFCARSANIDPLGFHNFNLGMDSIVGKYDDSKADKAGERLSEKNLYANPFNYSMCIFTGLGVWWSLHKERLQENDRFFLLEKTKEGAASTRYCEQLVGIVRQHSMEISNLMSMEKFNPYGFRKGSATYALSGTTAPPSLPAVARRGEWSIGTVLDCYWHFGSVGDQYLGRILAGLDPNSNTFNTLPPHFTTANPMETFCIKKAMYICYGSLVENRKMLPLLLRCFASLIYHSDKLISTMVEQPGHEFNKLSILHDRELIDEVKKFVTTEKTEGVMNQTTGIPPHVEMMSQLGGIVDKLSVITNSIVEQKEELKQAVNNALEEKTFENGNVSRDALQKMLEEYHGKSMEELQTQIDALQRSTTSETRKEVQQKIRPFENNGITNTYFYAGKYFAVPENFVFPKNATLKDGLVFWLKGQTVSVDGLQVVRPFRKLRMIDLPQRLKSPFKLQWTALYRMLERGVEFPDEFVEDEFENLYRECIELLRQKVSYCFAGKRDPLTWTIATWSNRARRSSIEKLGTEEDRANLPEVGERNRGGNRSTRRKRVKPNALYVRRQRMRQQLLVGPSGDEVDEADDRTDHDSIPTSDAGPSIEAIEV